MFNATNVTTEPEGVVLDLIPMGDGPVDVASITLTSAEARTLAYMLIARAADHSEMRNA